MGQVNNWLAPYTWEFVTAQNLLLCKAKDALHKPTSDGHLKTKQLWEKHHKEPNALGRSCRPLQEMP